ncbi:proline-rich protein 19 [Ciconia boyciana]|uniref:proline-rich protein 19 n=1 Tax=Ciconia boyciana TaxID=52775 RepID=UPI003BA2873B
MSHRSGRGDVRDAGDPRPRGDPHPTGPRPGRIKRRKTKRERDSAKFGRKVPGGGWRGAGPPPCRLPPPWGARPLASPLPAPKTVVISQNRLCQHRGMFNREVKSVDVERLLSPGPGQDAAPRSETPLLGGPSAAPQGDPRPAEQPPPIRPGAPRSEGEKGVPAEPPPRELAGQLCALLGGTRAFPGRDLVGERRRAVLAALLRRHRALPDLSVLLAHRNRGADAGPPGRWSPRTPERELSGSAEQGDFGEQKRSWDPTPPYSSTPGPLQGIVNRTPTYPAGPGTPSPIFGGDGKKRETPFSWTSGEEDDPRPDSPSPLFQPRGERTPSWGDPCRHEGSLPHGGLLPGSPPTRFPPGCTCGGPSCARPRTGPQPTPAAFGEDAGEGCSWSRWPPIAPPAFSPLTPRHRHPPRRSFATLFAPRCPDLCRGANPDPQTPDAWSPEASCQPGFAPGWPYAEGHVPRCRQHPRRHDPRQHDPLRHGSHRLRRPSAPPSPGTCCRQRSLGHGAPPESRRRRDWEDWWDAPEPGCRRGRGEPGWLRALRRLPLSCFPPSEVLERDGSPLPSPETWGCPCAGLY